MMVANFRPVHQRVYYVPFVNVSTNVPFINSLVWGYYLWTIKKVNATNERPCEKEIGLWRLFINTIMHIFIRIGKCARFTHYEDEVWYNSWCYIDFFVSIKCVSLENTGLLTLIASIIKLLQIKSIQAFLIKIFIPVYVKSDHTLVKFIIISWKYVTI